MWAAEQEGRGAAREGRAKVPFGLAEIDRGLGGGLTAGAFHEFFGAGDGRVVCPPLSLFGALARGLGAAGRGGSLVVWLGRDVTPYPSALASPSFPSGLVRSVSVDVAPGRETLWAAEECLASRAVGLVVVRCPGLTLGAGKRLSLAARRGGTLGCVVRPYEELLVPSAAASRWSYDAAPASAPAWRIRLEKVKGPAPAGREWIIGYGEEEDGEDGEALPLRLLPDLVDRPGVEEARPRRVRA